MMCDLLREYSQACEYPGLIDPPAVTRHLEAYVRALGIERRVVQVRRGWSLEEEEYADLAGVVDLVIRAARAARAGSFLASSSERAWDPALR